MQPLLNALRHCTETYLVSVDLTIYAKENDVLEEDRWKKLARLAARSKLTERLVKQVKLQYFRLSPQYKY